MISRIARSFAATAAAAAAVLTAAIVPQTLTAPEAQAQECPAVVVVAARGSGQNNQVYPTSYSNQGGRASNGWEGESIRAMLHNAEARYQATHGGNSLMKDVYVLGLEPQYYPATYPQYSVPNEKVPTTAAEVMRLAVQYANPVINMAVSAANQFMYSVQTGNRGVMGAISNYEASTGCRPQYILSGYSQGAMIIANHEQELARRGQLAGVVTFGNPLTKSGDPSVVGVQGAGGPMGFLPQPRANVNRVDYCLPLDAVCDLSANTLYAARPTGGSHGQYFFVNNQWDNQVYDSIGRFVDQVRYR
ncbi:cutinase family protein [Corynebacterium sp.]|uniref:cutinase family protein n=1 Tax=Corynebacterium sp. TaxID=1720 RepID=UPI0026DD6B01|nr:cutinase family protein [Corynebacterium sp.]MDO5031081.1 cutinase family protein [Corynebacterium sp.]